MDYKSTLNLPSTNFPMKASLAQNEPKILNSWTQQEIYKKIRQKGKGSQKYILHDGPPYANGNIHIGHALNKILKDIIIRFKTMRGFDSPYIPGWDCHGMPIEHQLFKDLNITKEMISQVDFRKKAGDYALKFVGIQKQEFIRLGIFGDWDNPYLTLNKKYEHGIAKVLSELVKQGYIYRGLKPVNWCTACETALAEAEVEHENKTSPSIYVKFKLKEGQKLSSGDIYLAVWTTTPWTLFGNIAVAVHPDILYTVVTTEQGTLVIAKNLVGRVFKDIGIAEVPVKTVKEIWGKDLAGMIYEHPFLKDGLERKVVLADYVSSEEGTGLVHTAPGHGQEDYATGLKYNLPILMPVDKSGRFDSSCEELSGENVLKSNPKIIEKLKSLGSLLFLGQIQHSYPHCWRCKNPIIFRATKQWFLNIGHNALRTKLAGIIEKDIKFVPASGRERIKAMVESRPDWCLSRQRYWGVPIPSVRCESCLEEILDARVVDNFAKKIEAQGSDCWFKEEVENFLPEGFVCPHCASSKFSRAEDILDVWFDSGSSFEAVLLADSNLEFPAQLYLEGSDQHRGWFQASLIPSTALKGISPFKAVLTHGFVVDGDGRKMSKSIGNVVSPQDIIKDYGADILRLWCASSNYSEDVRVSKDILLRLTDAYRKIRNTVRFLLGNLSDFSYQDAIPYERMLEIDRYSLSLAHNLLKRVTELYENFEFYKIYQEVYQFCILSMSNFYLDILKDRLYTFRKDGLERRSAQTAMQEILLILTKILAPILSFTAEEIWQYLPLEGKSESVHLADWPQIKEKYINDELENKWYNRIQFRVKVLKAIEEKRAAGLVGSSLEARVVIGITAENSFLKDFTENLAQFFIVSEATLKDAGDSSIEVHKAEGAKCPRCWNYSRDIGENKDHPEICPRCVKAVVG